MHYNDIFHFLIISGRSSVVEHLVANENVESSNLFARSKYLFSIIFFYFTYNIMSNMDIITMKYVVRKS